MDRDREHLLGMVLADDVVVEGLADRLRGRNIVARFRQRRLVFFADDVQAKLDTLVANEDGGPRNELAHLVLALAAERAVERVLRIATTNLLISEVAPAETLVHPTAHQAFPRRSSTDGYCPSKTCRLYVNLTTHSWPDGELIFQPAIVLYVPGFPRRSDGQAVTCLPRGCC